jgi:uridine kinase
MQERVGASVVTGEARGTAQVKLDDGRIYEAPVWTPLEAYIRTAGADRPWPSPIVAAMIDDELRELTYHIQSDVEVTPLGMDDRDGSRIYRRSLAFLLVVATRELFPEARLHIDHSMTFGGYYCEVEGRSLTPGSSLPSRRGCEIVAEDAPITKQRAD